MSTLNTTSTRPTRQTRQPPASAISLSVVSNLPATRPAQNPSPTSTFLEFITPSPNHADSSSSSSATSTPSPNTAPLHPNGVSPHDLAIIIASAWGTLILLALTIWLVSCFYVSPCGSRKSRRTSTMLWAPAFNSEPQDKEKGHTDGHLTRVGESNGFYYFDAPSSSDVSSQATIKKPQKAVERKYGGGVMDKDVSYKVVTAERSQGMDGRNGMEEFRAPVNSSQHPIAQIRPYESYSTNRTLIPHRPDRYEKQNEYRPASVQTAQSSRAALDRHASIFSQVQIPNIHNKPRHQHHDSLKPWNEPLLPSLESHSSSGFPTPPIYIPNVATPPTPIPPLAVHQNPHLAHLALPPPKQNQRDQRHHHHQPGTHPHRFSSTSTVGNVVTLYTHPSLQPYQQPLTNLGRISEEKPHSPTPSGSTGSTIITKSSIPIGASADVRIIGNGIRGSHNGSGGSKNTTTAISSMRRLMVHQQRSGTETYAAYEHMPSLADEVLVRKGDRLLVEQTFADGWAYGWNVRSRTRGMFPIGCLEVVGVTYPGMGGRVGEEVEAPRRTSSLVRRVVPGG